MSPEKMAGFSFSLHSCYIARLLHKGPGLPKCVVHSGSRCDRYVDFLKQTPLPRSFILTFADLFERF
jgi:hypothetical protein